MDGLDAMMAELSAGVFSLQFQGCGRSLFKAKH